jgi:hypothetical protein
MLPRPVAARLGHLCTNSIGHKIAVRSTTATSTRLCATGSTAADAGMDLQLEQLVRAIHASPFKAVIYVTGGCAQVIKSPIGCCLGSRGLLTPPSAALHALKGSCSSTVRQLPALSACPLACLAACLPCRVPPGCCQCLVPHPQCWRWLCHTAGTAWWSCWGRCAQQHTSRLNQREALQQLQQQQQRLQQSTPAAVYTCSIWHMQQSARAAETVFCLPSCLAQQLAVSMGHT